MAASDAGGLVAAQASGASRPRLTVDLGALVHNWRALDAASGGAEASAVVKADAYGTGIAPAAKALHAAGARTFFVAQMPEGAELREILGPGPVIYVFNGFRPEDEAFMRSHDLRPVIASPEQLARLTEALPRFDRAPEIGLHIESGINRMGFTSDELDGLRAGLPEGVEVSLVMSHLACADEPESSMNGRQRGAFSGRTALLRGIAPRAKLSLSATGGILLGEGFHFDLTRPGVGLYGGLPFKDARHVVTLEAPLLQVREIPKGETVGYGATWTAARPSRIGVLPLGYADGFFRTLKGPTVYLDGRPAPVVGRVSMDMITVDLTDLPEPPAGAWVEVLGPNQSVDQLAACAGTIGYEVLTALGPRYVRHYT